MIIGQGPSIKPSRLVREQLGRSAVAVRLARFKVSSREHTESDPRCYLAWCAEPGLDPPAAAPGAVNSMQEIRLLKPSTTYPTSFIRTHMPRTVTCPRAEPFIGYAGKPRKTPLSSTALAKSSQSMFAMFRLFSTPQSSGGMQRNGGPPVSA